MVRKKATEIDTKNKNVREKSAQSMSHNLRPLLPSPSSEAQFEIRLAIISAGERGSRGMCACTFYLGPTPAHQWQKISAVITST